MEIPKAGKTSAFVLDYRMYCVLTFGKLGQFWTLVSRMCGNDLEVLQFGNVS